MKRGDLFQHTCGVVRFERPDGADAVFVIVRTATTRAPCTLRIPKAKCDRLKPLTPEVAEFELLVEAELAEIAGYSWDFRARIIEKARARVARAQQRTHEAANAA